MTASTDFERWPAPSIAWRAVIALNLVYLVGFADRMIMSLLMPAIQQDMVLNDTQLGMLSGLAFGLWYTLLGLPAGYLADRAHRWRLLLAGLVVWSVMTVACGFASGFFALFLFRVGVGTGEAVLHPTATSLIGDYFAPAERPRAIGVYLMAGAAGITVAFLAGGLLVGHLESGGVVSLPLLPPLQPWQATFVVVGLIGLPLAALIAITQREPQRVGRGSESPASWTQLWQFFAQNRRTFFCHLLGVPLLLAGSIATVSWLPVLFLRVHDWPVGQTSISYALTGGLAAMAGALVAGRLPEFLRARGHVDATLLSCLYAGIWLNAFLIVGFLANDARIALAAFALSAVASLAPAISALSCVNEITPNRMRARVAACYSISVGLIANALAPFLAGVASQVLFEGPAAIANGLLLVSAIGGSIGALLLIYGLPAYRVSLRQAQIS